MSTAQARRLVLVSVLAILAINTYRGRLSTADVSLTKRLWGTGMLAIMLGFAADVAPQVAGPFAVLAALGLATTAGDTAFRNLLGKASGQVAASAPATPGGTAPGTAGLTTGAPPRSSSFGGVVAQLPGAVNSSGGINPALP